MELCIHLFCLLFAYFNCLSVIHCRVDHNNINDVEINIGYFLHITDIHYDANYSTNGLIVDMCHVPLNGTQKHDNISQWGNYDCDSSWPLIVNSMEFLQQQFDNPDFIMWTGDNVPHVPRDELSWPYVFDLITNTTELLLSSYPDALYIPTIGNHDAFPQDQVPVAPDDYYTTLLNQCKWNHMIHSQPQRDSFNKGGYYAVEVSSEIVMLALNTILYYPPDHEGTELDDPSGQFDWMEKQLKYYRKANKKVYLSGHISPGTDAEGFHHFTDNFNERFLGLLAEYSDVIAAGFFGHDHHDQLQIYYTQNYGGIPFFSAPALTPGGSDHNPGLRVFQYDRDSGAILEMSQYYLNLTDTILHDLPKWEFEYNFTTQYGVEDLSPANIITVIDQISDPTSTTFAKYFNSYSALYNTSVEQCDKLCAKNMYCASDALDYVVHAACLSMLDKIIEPQIAICGGQDPNIDSYVLYRFSTGYIWSGFLVLVVGVALVSAVFVYAVFYMSKSRRSKQGIYVLL